MVFAGELTRDAELDLMVRVGKLLLDHPDWEMDDFTDRLFFTDGIDMDRTINGVTVERFVGRLVTTPRDTLMRAWEASAELAGLGAR